MKNLLFTLLFLTIGLVAYGQKTAIGNYSTSVEYTKVFVSILKNIPSSKFSIKSSSKDEGTISATRLVGSKEYANLFIFLEEQEGKININATFTRNPGFTGGGKPYKWANEFGESLKNEVKDLTIYIEKK